MRVRAAMPEEYAWLCGRVGLAPSFLFTAIAAVDTSGIRGMVGYDAWTENSVQCHMAVDTPMAWRCLIPAAFEYPFVQQGRGLMLGLIASSNRASLRMAKHLGFVEAHRVRDGLRRGEDMVLVELRREACRFLERKAA